MPRFQINFSSLKGGTKNMELTMQNECFCCTYRRNVPYNAHILCTNPDEKMIGEEHGIKNGWFYYPLLFDPAWKLKKCRNFKEASDLKEKESES
jgi:hypothetical protein